VSATPETKRLPTTIALLTGTLLSSMDVTVVGTALPRVTGQLGGLELYPWVFSIYLLTATVTGPIWGKLADLFGRKRTYVAGISIFLAGSAACGAAPTMGWLVAARALQGLGAGAIFPLTQTIFGDIYPVETRARIQGIFSLTWGVSSIIGPTVGGAIVSYFPWPWVFYVNLPVGVVCLLVFMRSFHEHIERREHSLDVPGAVLLTAAITLALYALGRSGLIRPALLAAALALLGLFVLVERRAREPIVPLDLFSDRVVNVATLTGLATGPILFAFIAYVPLYLQGVLTIEPVWAGLVTAPMSLGWSSASFLGGRMILRLGYRPVIVGGTLLVALGSLALWGSMHFLPSTIGWTAFISAVVVYGAGMGSSFSAFVIATQDRVPWERRGVATALIALSRNLGSTLGVAAIGAFITADLAERLVGVPNAPTPSALLDPHSLALLSPSVLEASRGALAHAVLPAFLLVGGVGVVATLLSLAFPPLRAQKPT
jgi:EmrB/QacA subfamily drug resistance transporter